MLSFGGLCLGMMMLFLRTDCAQDEQPYTETASPFSIARTY